MLNMHQYQLLVEGLRNVTRLSGLQALPSTTARIWEIDPVIGVRGGSRPDAVDVTPFELASRWHERRIVGFSLLVDNRAEMARCVFQCPDGQPQEAECSEEIKDYENCFDAVKARCGTGGTVPHVVWRTAPGIPERNRASA
jgi:hypothetical protein